MPVAGQQDGDGGDGTLVLVVGPSGAGKDMLIQGARERLRNDPRFVFPERIITRLPDHHEPHRSVSEADFDALEADGALLLSWGAHGNRYGVPQEIMSTLEAGRVVVVNVSRTVIEEARKAFANLAIVNVTARPDVLRERLTTRGRESSADVEDRVTRQVPLPTFPDTPVETIDNSGPPATAVAALVGLLQRYAVSGQRERSRKGAPAAG